MALSWKTGGALLGLVFIAIAFALPDRLSGSRARAVPAK